MGAALCHRYDATRSRDVIGHVAIRLSIDDFLYVLNRNQTRILHDAITHVITPRSTICVVPIDVEHGRPLC